MNSLLLLVSVLGPSMEEAQDQVARANELECAVELRADCLAFRDLRPLCELAEHEVMITIKDGSALEHAALLPDYMDLEYDGDPAVLQTIKKSHPTIQLIGSYHNWEETPQDLSAVLQSMQHPCFDIYKIATKGNSSLDALRMLRLLQETELPLIAHCMGADCAFSRILAPIYGSRAVYAAPDASQHAAPGQFTVQDMREIYGIERLNTDTRVFGLVGDPVAQSPGHHIHNAVFKKTDHNAVYVRMRFSADESAAFLDHAKKLAFAGLSVTMPLKELFLDHIQDPHPGSVNTLRIDPTGLHACNTDGAGALDAIEARTSIAGKHLVICGAGGTAKAIAYEALRRGATVTILNRSLDRAQRVAVQLGCAWGSYNELGDYDIIVNALPMQLKEHPLADRLLADRIALDVNYSSTDSPFLRAARACNCALIHGIEMFVGQAVRQQSFWWQDQIDESAVRHTIQARLAGYVATPLHSAGA